MSQYSFNPTLPIIVDTDSSVDDLLGLTLLKQAGAPVAAIVVSYGAFVAPVAYERVLRFTKSLNWSVPVVLGAEKPLNRPYTPRDIGHGDHTPTTSELFARLTRKLSSSRPSLTSWIQDLAAIHSPNQPLVYVCMGPQTNLARLINKSVWRQAIQHIILTGGAFEYPGDYNTYSEYNFSWDPCAVTPILQSGIPITVIPLNTTDHVLLTPDQTAQLNPTLFDRTLIDPYLYHYIVERRQFSSVQKNHQKHYVGAAMHGLATATFLLKPNYFEGTPTIIKTDLIQTYRGMVYAQSNPRSKTQLIHKCKHHLLWQFVGKQLFTSQT